LAVTAHDNTKICSGVLDNVAVNPPTVYTAASATPSIVTGTTTPSAFWGPTTRGIEPYLHLGHNRHSARAGDLHRHRLGQRHKHRKNATAIFTKSGTYYLQVTIKDSGGLTVASSVT